MLASAGRPGEARRMSTQQAVEHFLEQREHYGISYIQVRSAAREFSSGAYSSEWQVIICFWYMT
jgi:hypothetical protein